MGRFDGWQRLGIVLTVFWVMAIATTAWNNPTFRVTTPTGEVYEVSAPDEKAAINAFEQLYNQQATHGPSENYARGRTIKRVIPPAIWWLLIVPIAAIWCLGFAVAWVRAGFRQRPAA